MRCSVIVTAIGKDHPGIIKALSKVLANHDANWLNSKVISLAGKFSAILIVDLPSDEVNALTLEIEALANNSLALAVERRDITSERQTDCEFTLELVGQDRPGVIHDITQLLARHNINVGKLETEIQNASMSGEQMFFAKAQVWIPIGLDLTLVQDELEEMANELMVDINLLE